MKLLGIRHDWPEQAGFTISRPQGIENYTFLHFLTPAQITVSGKTLDASPGACIFYSPDTPQWFCATGPLLHNWMHPDPSFRQLLEKYRIPEDTLLYPSNTAFISEVFWEMETEFFSDNPFRQELLESLMDRFLIAFSRSLDHSAPSLHVSSPIRARMSQLRQQILSSSEQRWSVQAMAKQVGFSISRFHTLYKALFGSSPMQDLITARISRAQYLLLSQPHQPITTIAEQLGYNDQYHFIRQFKGQTGQSPDAYRKNRMKL